MNDSPRNAPALMSREDPDALAYIPANSDPASIVPRIAEIGGPPIGRTNRARTLDDVSSVIAEREAELRRDPFPVSEIRIEGDYLIAGEQQFILGDEGWQRLCKVFQAPADYLGTLKPDLRAHVLQYHFAECRYTRATLTNENSFILSRGGAFLDLGRSDLLTLDNAAVLQATREGIGDHAADIEVQNFSLDDECFMLDAVSPRIAEQARPGDIIRGGVHVSHSQFNGQATQVMAYVIRLVCMNGMVQRQCVGDKRRSTPRTRRLAASRPEAREMQMAQVRKLVADTWVGLQEKLTAIRRLTDKRVVEVRTTLDKFLRQAHLFSRGLMDRLLAAWELEGSEATAFGVLNTLTRVATHAEDLPAWQRQRLARLAGIYANQDMHICPHCWSVLNAAK